MISKVPIYVNPLILILFSFYIGFYVPPGDWESGLEWCNSVIGRNSCGEGCGSVSIVKVVKVVNIIHSMWIGMWISSGGGRIGERNCG